MVDRGSSAAILLVMLVAVGGVVPATAQSTAQSDDWPDTFDSATQVSPGTYDGVVGAADDKDVMKVPVERGTPGFGVASALAALLVVAYVAARQS